jgi:hypothetical protein
VGTVRLQEAANKVRLGSHHPLSIQRARSARANLADREQLKVKWDAYLASFRRSRA